MRKLFYLLLLLGNSKLNAQTCTATGATINYTNQVIRNIKTDFGAKGDGITNDHDAFKSAETFINNNNGNVYLYIPDGVYLVGKQASNVGNASYYNNVYKGEALLFLENINNVSIVGAKHATIIYKDSLKFGTFDVNTGLPPANPNLYNPSSPGNSNPGYDYKYAATIGNAITLSNCENIEIKNVELHGNSLKYTLGGYWGLGGKPIELAQCHGILMYDVKNISLQKLNIHHFGTDNIGITYSTTSTSDTANPGSYNILMDSIIAEYAGRNGLSWLGGKQLCVLNSSFNHNAATGRISTSPGYGMDIEPEGQVGKVICSKGFFYDCNFIDNGGLGFTAGTSLDNPVSAGGFGFSYNHYFLKCTAAGTPTHNYINRVTFDSCRFYGSTLNYASSIDANIQPAVYKNTLFSDCYNGKLYGVNETLLNCEYSYRMEVQNCTFHKFYLTPGNGYNPLIYLGSSQYPCSEDDNKPLIQNSDFKCFQADNNVLTIISNPRRMKFLNNRFYKSSSDMIRWYNVPGCDPGIGEGNVDLGNGFQYFTWPANYQYPDCSDQKECERDLYVSDIVNSGITYSVKNLIQTDATMNITAGNVLAKAENYIQLNNTFNGQAAAGSEIVFEINTCTLTLANLRNNTEASKVLVGEPKEMAVVKDLISISPNPSNGNIFLRVSGKQTGIVYVSLVNMQGRIVTEKNLGNKQEYSFNKSLSFNHLSSGMYMIKVLVGDISKIEKLIIVK